MKLSEEDTTRLIAGQQKEIEALRRWKSDALLLLTQYDDLAESVGCPLGASKVDNLAKELARLREVNAKLLAACERWSVHPDPTHQTSCGCRGCELRAAIAAAKEPS